jgi:hypothetical protein
MPEALVELVRVTVPVKPFRLAKFIAVEPEDPTLIWIAD